MFTCKTCGEQAGFTADWPTRVVFCSCYTNAFTAERDRLAAENAELRKGIMSGDFILSLTKERDAANATLDWLRELMPEGFDPKDHDAVYLETLINDVLVTLYPKEKDNG